MFFSRKVWHFAQGVSFRARYSAQDFAQGISFRARCLISRTMWLFAQGISFRARCLVSRTTFRARCLVSRTIFRARCFVSRKYSNSQRDGSSSQVWQHLMEVAAPRQDNNQGDGSTLQSYIYIIDLCPQNLKNASICNLYISI